MYMTLRFSFYFIIIIFEKVFPFKLNEKYVPLAIYRGRYNFEMKFTSLANFKSVCAQSR